MTVGARRAVLLAGLAAAFCAAAPISAPAASTSGLIHVSFAPYRLGAKATAAISLGFADGPGGVPAPLSGAVLRLPAGLRVDLSGIAVCRPSHLRSRGASGCMETSLLGRGHALLEVHAGSQTLPENATISVFRGPDSDARPTFEIFGQGSTPLYERAISTAVLGADAAPFGSKLTLSVPPIPTLTYEPNASFSSLSLTIGNAGARSRGVIALPSRCPGGGFPFAASFTFADRGTASASTRLPCP
jgi:hypothetical protein